VSATASMRVHRPRGLSDRPPALLWIHGGGYVAGSAAMNDRAVRKMAAHLGALAASVEYRLAPEHPYPAALDDCYAALQWLAARDDVDRRRILIAGKSGGGGLAAALTLRHMDAGLVGLAGQPSFIRCWTIERFGERPPPQREAGHRKTIRSAGAPTWVVNPARGM
jgi:acetyl esterase/lipase